jgi:hypothetical protein
MLKVVLLFTTIFLSSMTLYAQTAQLSGTVRDPSNAAIPQATVEASDQATGARYRTQTNETGSYTLPYLTPGTYDLTVEAPGFRTVRQTGVRLDVAQRAQLDFALEVGAVAQSIEVEAGAPLVNTQDATVKTVIDRQFVANLPLNGRSFQSLLQMVPGVVPNKVVGEGGQFAVNGQRAGSNYFTVDGVSANVGISTVPFAQMARNALRSPNVKYYDMSLSKRVNVTESVKLMFEANAFNVFNRTQFAAPNATLSSATFGRVTSTRAGTNPRQMQFGLKLSF